MARTKHSAEPIQAAAPPKPKREKATLAFQLRTDADHQLKKDFRAFLYGQQALGQLDGLDESAFGLALVREALEIRKAGALQQMSASSKPSKK